MMFDCWQREWQVSSLMVPTGQLVASVIIWQSLGILDIVGEGVGVLVGTEVAVGKGVFEGIIWIVPSQ